MKHHSLFVLASLSLALLLVPATASAQGCFECDWLDNCADADWHGHGSTQCVDEFGTCITGGDDCWGPDPEMAVIFVRADGTYSLPSIGDTEPSGSTELAAAQSTAALGSAPFYERNCKGLITRRVYGKAELAVITQGTRHLTI